MIRRLRALKVLAVAGLALVLVMAGEISQAVAESFAVEHEQHLLKRVNEHRDEHGVRPVQQNTGLLWVARRQASRMSAASRYFHNRNLRKEADDAIPGWLQLGENVGAAFSAEQVHRAFLDSAAHHSIIDDKDWNIVGIGVVSGQRNRFYYTENFAELGKSRATRGKGRDKATPKRTPKKTAKPTRKTKPKSSPTTGETAPPRRSPSPTQTARATPTQTARTTPTPEPEPAENARLRPPPLDVRGTEDAIVINTIPVGSVTEQEPISLGGSLVAMMKHFGKRLTDTEQHRLMTLAAALNALVGWAVFRRLFRSRVIES